jgi:hypothetical protein
MAPTRPDYSGIPSRARTRPKSAGGTHKLLKTIPAVLQPEYTPTFSKLSLSDVLEAVSNQQEASHVLLPTIPNIGCVTCGAGANHFDNMTQLVGQAMAYFNDLKKKLAINTMRSTARTLRKRQIQV